MSGQQTGTVSQVSISLGGLPKRAIPEGSVAPLGVEGDRHNHPQIHGGPRKAILIIAAETIEDLQQRGYPLFFGAMGENFTTRGIDYRQLRIGDRLRVGGAMIEITQPRGPCKALDVYGLALKEDVYDLRVKAKDPTSPRWGMSGLYCSVVEPGPVAEGDIIAVVSQVA